MSQIPVLFPVKRDISHAPLIDIQLRKTAVLQLGAFQKFFTLFDIALRVIHTSLRKYLERPVFLFPELLILFQHRCLQFQMEIAFFLIIPLFQCDRLPDTGKLLAVTLDGVSAFSHFQGIFRHRRVGFLRLLPGRLLLF